MTFRLSIRALGELVSNTLTLIFKGLIWNILLCPIRVTIALLSKSNWKGMKLPMIWLYASSIIIQSCDSYGINIPFFNKYPLPGFLQMLSVGIDAHLKTWLSEILASSFQPEASVLSFISLFFMAEITISIFIITHGILSSGTVFWGFLILSALGLCLYLSTFIRYDAAESIKDSCSQVIVEDIILPIKETVYYFLFGIVCFAYIFPFINILIYNYFDKHDRSYTI